MGDTISAPPLFERRDAEKLEELLELLDENPGMFEHMQKLADAFYINLEFDNAEWGGIDLDCKRPFGNSYMPGDVAEIIGEKYPYDKDGQKDEELESYCIQLYNYLPTFLKYQWAYFKSRQNSTAGAQIENLANELIKLCEKGDIGSVKTLLEFGPNTLRNIIKLTQGR